MAVPHRKEAKRARKSGYLVQQTTALLMFVVGGRMCLSRDKFKRPSFEWDVFEALLKIGCLRCWRVHRCPFERLR